MFLPKTTIDFDKIASMAAAEFFTNKTPLTDTVAKLAAANNLNPSECRRLTEKANTQAVLRLLQSSKDKKSEIELANPEAVLIRTHNTETTPAQVKTASFSFPETRRKPLQASFGVFEKMASTLAQEPVKKQIPLATQRMLLANEKGRLSVEKLKQETKAKDGLDFLISEFSKYRGPNFSSFAREAKALHGAKVVPVLKAMSSALGEKLSLDKVAGVIDDTTQLHSVCTSVIGSLVKLAEVEQQLGTVSRCLESKYC